MEHQFVFTPADVYRTLLALCAFVVTISGATKIIIDAINKIRKPERTQNERLTSLEARVMNLENKSHTMDEFRKKADEAMMLNMKALMDMMDHMIYGDHIEALKATQAQMRNYMARHTFHMEGEKNE